MGGTILGPSRSAELPTPDGQARARAQLRALGIDALLVIGTSPIVKKRMELLRQVEHLLAR